MARRPVNMWLTRPRVRLLLLHTRGRVSHTLHACPERSHACRWLGAVMAAALAFFAAAALWAQEADAPPDDPLAVEEPDAEEPLDAEGPGDGEAGNEFRELRNLYRESPAKAAEGFRAFVAEHPDGDWADDAQYWLAMSLDRARAKRRDVLEAYEALVERFPDSSYVPDALFAAGELWQTRAERPEDYTQAVRAYQTFLDRCPTNARAVEALLRLGEIYDRLRNYDAAAAWFRRVIDEHPQSPFAARAHGELAAVYLKLNRPTESLALYEKLLKTELSEPQRVSARLGMVDCFLLQKDGLAAAAEACAQIREDARQKRSLEDYADLKTREKMSQWYLNHKRFDEAEAEYQAYLARFPRSDGAVQAKLGIGAVRLAAGRPAAAREMFHAVAETLEPGAEKPPTHLLRAILSEAYTWELERKWPEARALYKKLADSWPRTNEAREALRRIERIDKAAPPAKAAK